MDVRCLFVAGWIAASVAAVPAQERASAVVEIVAAGGGAAPAAMASTLTSRAQLVELLTALAWPGEVPDLDCRRQTVRFLPLGAGRGGALTVTRVARGDDFLFRLDGQPDAATVADRWAVVRYDPEIARAAAGEHMRRVRFEADAPGPVGEAWWRSVDGEVLPLAGGIRVPPTTVGWVPESEAPMCFTDAIAFAAFARRHANQEQPVTMGQLGALLRHIDFGRQIVLVRPIDRPERELRDIATVLGSHTAFYYTHDRRDGAGSMVRGRLPQRPEPYLGVFVLPRVNGRFDVELPVPERDDLLWRATRLTIEDPATAAVMPVLRSTDKGIADRSETFCQLATTPSEWRELRRKLAEFGDLPDDWCDFTSASVVAIATAAGRVSPGFELRVVEEEGVDVLTAVQRAPSGVDPGAQAYGLLAVVPKRQAQLAVVLRRECGPSPGSEQTLRVFAATAR